jgi:transcriptional regulator with XRE-family HTH domain
LPGVAAHASKPAMTTTLAHDARARFGDLLRAWRRRRGMSQLDLALSCDVSQRHVSFLESGRARPSRGMVLHLAGALAVPLRQQNELLLAAGFAPAFGERSAEAPDMRLVTDALKRMLAQQEPFPALIVDGGYKVLDANRAAAGLIAFLLGGSAAGAGAPLNLAELILRPDALRPVMENWSEAALWLLRRLRAEAVHQGGPGAADPIAAFLHLPDVAKLARQPREEVEHPPTLVARFRRDGVRLGLFTIIATVGTPLDAALQDVRVEFFFPADPATEAWLREQAEAGR